MADCLHCLHAHAAPRLTTFRCPVSTRVPAAVITPCMSPVKFVAPVCLAGLLVALIGFLVLAASIGASSSAAGSVAGSECTTAGPLPGLDAGAAANARTVAATASARGGQRAALIAVTTG